MKKFLTGSALKIIAVIAMVLDHFGQIILKNGIILNAPYSAFSDRQFELLLQAADLCHIIGRIAFPIFCFLLVEGFLHTRNLKKYAWNLAAFAILSEPVYDFANAGTIFSLAQQNVLFSLLLGLIVLMLLQKYEKSVLAVLGIVCAGAVLSYFCKLDGWYYGIGLIAVFYLFRSRPAIQYVLALTVMYLSGLDFSLSGIFDPYFITAAASLLLISRYNGTRGLRMKYFFYVFYPAHLLLFSLINIYMIFPMF